MMKTKDLPLFKVTRDPRDPNLLRFWCPYCRVDHTHGSGFNPRAQTTHRVAHCVRGPMLSGGYMLRVPKASRAEEALIRAAAARDEAYRRRIVAAGAKDAP